MRKDFGYHNHDVHVSGAEMSISVCMATYCGEKYVSRQIISILKQLSMFDELVIIDDCSTDDTVRIIRSFKDPRIILFQNKSNIGHVKSFEKALLKSTKSIIMLADQDDEWEANRVKQMVRTLLKSGKILLSSKQIITDGSKKILVGIGPSEIASNRNVKNICDIFTGKSLYFGCTMAFHRKLIKFITPFPDFIEAHDLYIAIAANMIRSIVHSNVLSLNRTYHTNNLSLKKRGLFQMIRTRIVHIQTIIHITAQL